MFLLPIVLAVVLQAAAEGPAITDRGLFEMPDLSRPGLEKVEQAVARGS